MEERNARGFLEFGQFHDFYGAKVKVTESSLASEPCVWVFVEGGDANLGVKAAAHLTMPQVKMLRDMLDAALLAQDSAPPCK